MHRAGRVIDEKKGGGWRGGGGRRRSVSTPSMNRVCDPSGWETIPSPTIEFISRSNYWSLPATTDCYDPMCRFYGFNDHRPHNRLSFPPSLSFCFSLFFFPSLFFFFSRDPGERNGFGSRSRFIYLVSQRDTRTRVINLDLEISSWVRATRCPACLGTIGQCPVLF